MLVDVYHCGFLYRYFSRLLFEKEAFLRSTASLCSSKFLSFSHDLTLPIVRSTFQLTGRHDLIWSARSVEIFAASPNCSTSGSKAYFLFKLYDPTSGKSDRQLRPDSVYVYWTNMCPLSAILTSRKTSTTIFVIYPKVLFPHEPK